MATINNINSAYPIGITSGATSTTSFTANTPITGGTTGTAPLQSVVSLGSSGDILTSAGSSSIPAFESYPDGSLELIETQTVSGVSAVNFTSIGSYNNYLFIGSNISMSTSVNTALRVSTDGGSTYLADLNYNSGLHRVPYNSITYTAYSVAGGNQFVVLAPADSGASSSFVVWLYNIETNKKMSYVGEMAQINGGTLEYGSPHGWRSVSETINAFSWIPNGAGNISGTISLYGVNN